MSPEERRVVVVVALLARRKYGSASPELVIRRAGLERVAGYSALAQLKRRGLVERDPLEGVLVADTERPGGRPLRVAHREVNAAHTRSVSFRRTFE